MAYTYVWEPTLPQVPQKGFSESIGALILRTPMDAGPAKQRYRGRRSNTMQLTFIMTTQQRLKSLVYSSVYSTTK